MINLLYKNIIFPKAQVSREIELTNGCVIGAACSLTEQEIVPENTIVYGSQCQRREMNDKPYVIIVFIYYSVIFILLFYNYEHGFSILLYFSLKLDN